MEGQGGCFQRWEGADVDDHRVDKGPLNLGTCQTVNELLMQDPVATPLLSRLFPYVAKLTLRLRCKDWEGGRGVKNYLWAGKPEC